MAMSFTLYVLHTTHTDIGYTDTQEAVKAHHIAFIREALDLIDRDPRFRWNCEAYWAVHQFLKVADDHERDRFVTAVHNGQIGLSGSHFNITDLIPGYVLNRIMGDDRAERESLGLTAKVCADGRRQRLQLGLGRRAPPSWRPEPDVEHSHPSRLLSGGVQAVGVLVGVAGR